MCCSTGVCGQSVDPALPRVTADLDWLKRQGVEVERYNLAQQPQAFVANPKVNAALHEPGNDCLPLILVEGEVVSRGFYPDRSGLAHLAGIAPDVESEPAAAKASWTSLGNSMIPGMIECSAVQRRTSDLGSKRADFACFIVVANRFAKPQLDQA